MQFTNVDAALKFAEEDAEKSHLVKMDCNKNQDCATNLASKMRI